LPKSAESIEKKRVEFFLSAKKCRTAQKSAQECETKAFRCCRSSPENERTRKSLMEQRIKEFFGLKTKKRPETAADQSAGLSSVYAT
jgi:hypothetical protein